jgi:TatA/E family protein of Tat protein translocase
MNLGFPEMIFIFLLALIIFGPKKLPEIGRQIGRALNEFKRASNEFKSQIENEISNLELEGHKILPPVAAPQGSIPAGNPAAAASLDPQPENPAPPVGSKAADA